jgi:hypothetical protein
MVAFGPLSSGSLTIGNVQVHSISDKGEGATRKIVKRSFEAHNDRGLSKTEPYHVAIPRLPTSSSGLPLRGRLPKLAKQQHRLEELAFSSCQ